MAETLQITEGQDKTQIYEEILPQIKSLIESEPDLTANLANICAVLNTAFGHLWTGFYIAQGNDLVLGPFQGPLACTRIPFHPVPRGVCGAAATEKITQIVPNVDKFPGHIACSSLSKSEIVVPLVANEKIRLILDIDSTTIATFDDVDAKYLEELIALIHKQHFSSP